MTLNEETMIFLTFVFIGMLFCGIFDFFRAIRRIKKNSTTTIYIQDILYFVIIGIILLIAIVQFMETEIRLYLILAIGLGILIYVSVFGNFVRNVYINILKFSGGIIDFIMLPIKMYLGLFAKQINILKKNVVKYCKKISYMINLNRIKKK